MCSPRNMTQSWHLVSHGLSLCRCGDRLMGFDRKHPPRPRDHRMVRWRQVQECPQAQRIGRPPREGPLRIQSFEIPQEQQSEIAPQSKTRPSHRRVEPRAQSFDECVEAGRAQNLVQARVERMPGALRQIRPRPISIAATRRSALCLAPCAECSTADRSCRSPVSHLHQGC